MTLTGDAAERFMADAQARARRARADRFAAAKADAAMRGKEPFGLGRLEAMGPSPRSVDTLSARS